MNIVYYCSDSFSEICGVAVQSLVENNTDSDEITIYIVEDKISETNKNRLRGIVDKYNRNLVFIRMPSQEELYPDVKMNLGHTYARMALGEILPDNVDRVLSLDSDTLVLDSIKAMYNTKFSEDEFVAGVLDCVGDAIQTKVLHAPKTMKYCNAGMFLIDLKKWRELKVGEQLLDVVTHQADGKKLMYFLEQDLMNWVFDGHIKVLHPRYNLLTSIAKFEYKEIIRMKHPTTYYSAKSVAEAKKKPAIIHATTCFYIKRRMWVENSDHPMAEKYIEYRNKTPWKNEPRIKDTRPANKKIYGGVWHCMPRSCAVWSASFMINCVRPVYAWATTKASISTIATQS
ncbi:glycosyltransferase family 8 protein [Anaerostipes sp.]|uniref:glycosyltransferase family 8 protein n=1 Tax=Anaerostipes sp. TaxID=1872530 RepID=UPI002589DAF3|nr:glycosyltransferase family 8 protein [Anaerostipes sp.]